MPISTIITSRQRTWFEKEATPDQREVFLSKGPVEVGDLMNMTSHEHYYAPALRGWLIQGRHPSYQAALAAGKAYQADLVERAKALPALDEVALGIDGGNALIAERCEDFNGRIEQILHLGGMLAALDAFPDPLNEFMDDFPTSKIDQIGPLADFAKVWKKESRGADMRSRDVLDFFVEWARDKGVLGYLIQVAQPSRGKGQSFFSWGCYTTAWFYGETLGEAVDRAHKVFSKLWRDHDKAIDKANKAAKKGQAAEAPSPEQLLADADPERPFDQTEFGKAIVGKLEANGLMDGLADIE